MRYVVVLIILFLVSCSTNQTAPANPITEISQKEISPLEKRKLLLSTPYVLEILPEFSGLYLDTNKTNIGDDLESCVSTALLYPIDAIPFIQSHIQTIEKQNKEERSKKITGTGNKIITAGAVAGALTMGPLGILAGGMFSTGVATPYLLIARVFNEALDEGISAENSAKAFIIKSITIRCLISRGYAFDIYSALILGSKNNIKKIKYADAEKFFETYGDLAIAEIQTILNDADPYEIIENGSYYKLSEDEKADLKDYLEQLKYSQRPLRLINRDLALQALGAADEDPFVYFDPLTKRFMFKL